jgi:chromosome segregation ATPase
MGIALEAKVEQWSTAILELAALARNQNQAMQETSQNSLRLTSALSSFEQESVQLRTLIKQLGGSLTELKGANGKRPEGLNQSALQTLIPVLKAIKTDIEDMERSIDQTQQIVQDGSDDKRRLTYLTAMQVTMVGVMLMAGYWFYGQMTAQQALLWKQSSWALTKLERIEKALGVQPDK